MDCYFNIASLIIFFGSALCFLNTMERLIREISFKKNYPFLFSSLINGIILLGIGLIVNLVPLKYPITIFFFATSIYLLGPISLLMFYFQVYPERDIQKRLGVHFIPAFTIFIIEIIFQTRPLAFRIDLLKGLLATPMDNVLTPVFAIGAVHVAVYFIYGLKLNLSVWNVEQIMVGARLVAIAIIIAIISVFLITIGFLFRHLELFFISGIMITVIHMFIYVFRSRAPDFFHLYTTEFKQRKYEKSLLHGLNTELLHERLTELMDKQKIYEISDLSLTALSEKLLITPHQLSQYLNEYLNLNFRNYINMHRIEEAKRLLVNKSERSIISICYEVGFNSISTFNVTFRKYVGSSPKEFRVKNN